MRKLLFAVVCFGLMLMPAFAGDSDLSTWNVTGTDGVLESGWVVSIPSGSSDFFNTRYDGVPTYAWGISIGSADFASGLSYPTAGLFAANLGVDGSGNTPDLGNGISAGSVPGGGSVFNYVYGSFGASTDISAFDPGHVVCQFPGGDSGLLGCGQDDNSSTNFSGWTQDGYTTAANGVGGTFGLNINHDIIRDLTTPDGGLAEMVNLADRTGDFTTVTIGAGSDFGLAFFTGTSGTLWMLFLSFAGLPVKGVTGVLPSFPDGTGGGFFRAGQSWPPGFGGFTFNFVAVSGQPGVPGTVGVSNEITLKTFPDPTANWGIRDDCTYESGWVVSFPTGSSDYFNVNFNQGADPGAITIVDFKLAAMDFGAAFSAYPTSGVFDSNFGVDPSGLTPDLGVGYEVAPLTFPAGIFASTCGLMQVRTFGSPIDYQTTFPGHDDVHGVIQLPPGDSGLLGVGGDTNMTPPNWYNGWTLDGYTTPANDFSATAGFGIRLGAL